MAHLKAYVPNIPKHMWERSQFYKIVGARPLQSQVIRKVAAQNAVFSAFFERKCSLTAKPSIFDPIVLYIFGKLSIWRFRKSGWNSIFDIMWSVRFAVTLCNSFEGLIWIFVLMQCDFTDDYLPSRRSLSLILWHLVEFLQEIKLKKPKCMFGYDRILYCVV